MESAWDFSGKVVIVTGGGKGIGRGITEAFLRAGARVVICSRTPPDEPIKVGRRRPVFMEANVRKPAEIVGVVAATLQKFKRVDVLVNNAGGSPHVKASEASNRLSAAIIDLNLTAPLNFASKVNDVMQKQRGGGVIINIASISGCRPSPGTAAYGAAKAGLINLTQSLAIEWAPKVRVCAVSPGLVATEHSTEHYGDAACMARVAQTVPMGRFATPDEVAQTCLFIASPNAAYLSGMNIVVHGGGETPMFLAAAQPVDDE